MEAKSRSRKGTIITLGEDVRARIPRCMDNIFKIEAVPVTDGEDLEKDETFRLHHLRTILVEGTTVVDNGRAVNVNGEFDIPLEPRLGESDEDELLNNVYSVKDEAIAAWEVLTNLQVKRAEKMQEKINETLTTLKNSQEERQY